MDIDTLISNAASGEEGLWESIARLDTEGRLPDVAEELWRLVTDVDRPVWMRREVMCSIASHEVVGRDTLSVDLGRILSSQDEEDGLRGDAADLIGGLNLEACLEVVESILEDGTQGAEVVFWTLYAASQIGGTRTPELVARYVGDARTVALGSIEATIDEEATWALARLRGEDVEPAWDARFAKAYQ